MIKLLPRSAVRAAAPAALAEYERKRAARGFLNAMENLNLAELEEISEKIESRINRICLDEMWGLTFPKNTKGE